MNIILVSKGYGKSRMLSINVPVALGLLALLVTFILGSAWLGYSFAGQQRLSENEGLSSPVVGQWQLRLQTQRDDLDSVRQRTLQQVDALTLRLGEMQGRLLRLDALGQRFVESGLVGSEEFNFDQPAAVGGPEDSLEGEPFSTPELSMMIERLDARIADREQQLRLLDNLMSRKKIEDERFVAGRPITWGRSTGPHVHFEVLRNGKSLNPEDYIQRASR